MGLLYEIDMRVYSFCQEVVGPVGMGMTCGVLTEGLKSLYGSEAKGREFDLAPQPRVGPIDHSAERGFQMFGPLLPSEAPLTNRVPGAAPLRLCRIL
jgi:hypothetical protein